MTLTLCSCKSPGRLHLDGSRGRPRPTLTTSFFRPTVSATGKGLQSPMRDWPPGVDEAGAIPWMPPQAHPSCTGLLLTEAQLLTVAGQGCLLSGPTDQHEFILEGPGQLQKVHLLIHAEVEALGTARPVGGRAGPSEHPLALRALRCCPADAPPRQRAGVAGAGPSPPRAQRPAEAGAQPGQRSSWGLKGGLGRGLFPMESGVPVGPRGDLA